MVLEIQQLTGYAAWLLFVLGVLSFVTALIVQAVKEWPPFKAAPTSLVAMVVGLILTVVAFFAAAAYFHLAVTWYMVVAAVVAGFFVWYIATNGWDKFNELWNRYKKDTPTK